jgi:hypothetical protein
MYFSSVLIKKSMRFLAPITLCLSFFYFSNYSIASHVVGGDIRITHINNFSYELSLTLYRDASGAPFGATEVVDVYKRGSGIGTPSSISSFTLTRIYDSIIQPQTPGCQSTVSTIERHVYLDTVFLSPTVYTHPSGYLFKWGSCCRNPSIINGGSSQGASILTLFSPVVNSAGVQIINSSPQLYLPSSDYTCTSQLFSTNLGGIDPDGDSIAFGFYTPFNSSGLGSGIVNPLHSPYANPASMLPGISWNPTYSATDAVHGWSGPPDPAVDRLRINAQSGQITVTPRIFGMHLFGIWCREFRDINGDGIKEVIGSIYRDFQLPVVSNCPSPDTLNGPIITDSMGSTIGVPGDTVHVPGFLSQRGTIFRVWDENYDPLDPVGQNANFAIRAVNFEDTLVDINPKQYNFMSQYDTVWVTVEFHPCAYSGSVPYEVQIVTSKGHCPLPYYDSTGWYFDVDSVANCDSLGLKISGRVTKNGFSDSGIQGYALLLKPDSNGQIAAWSLAGVSYLDSSYFQFTNVDPGTYYIQAFLDPQDPDFLNFLPSYHISATTWISANSISVPFNQTGKDIDLVPINGPTAGPGIIYGTVVEGGNKSSSPGDPVKDVQVQLWDAQGNKLAMKLTDATGRFSFSLIDFGDYQLKVEVPGLPHLPEPVFLSAGDPVQEFLFTVNSTEVITAINQEEYLERISIYPNPASPNGKLLVSGPPRGISEFLIRDSRGILVGKKTVNFQESDVTEFELGEFELSPGVYLMSILNKEKIHSIRLLIIQD